MSRRSRAIAFLGAALLCAALAASLASGYGARVQQRYGPLRQVLVASVDLPAGKAIDPGATSRLQVRRVPARFVPPGALSIPGQAIGRTPAAVVPRGSYLLAAQLGDGTEDGADAGRQSGTSPVQIGVTGADALAEDGGDTVVDVVVTTQPAGGGPGRTYVAARGVELLDLRRAGGEEADSGEGPPAQWIATLALSRDEALKLIAAENFARQVRLLARS